MVQYQSNNDGGRETISKMPEQSKTLLQQGDVSESDVASGWFSELDPAFGVIDIRINNAGIDGERQEIAEAIGNTSMSPSRVD